MARQAAAVLLRSRSSALIQEVITVWQQLQQQLWREREVERLRDEALRYRISREGVARQAAAALLGSQASVLTQEVITAWRVECLREVALRYPISREGVARQAEAALVGSQARALTQEVITAWQQLQQQVLREREVERP